jgi:hypothetical protein
VQRRRGARYCTKGRLRRGGCSASDRGDGRPVHEFDDTSSPADDFDARRSLDRDEVEILPEQGFNIWR